MFRKRVRLDENNLALELDRSYSSSLIIDHTDITRATGVYYAGYLLSSDDSYYGWYFGHASYSLNINYEVLPKRYVSDDKIDPRYKYEPVIMSLFAPSAPGSLQSLWICG